MSKFSSLDCNTIQIPLNNIGYSIGTSPAELVRSISNSSSSTSSGSKKSVQFHLEANQICESVSFHPSDNEKYTDSGSATLSNFAAGEAVCPSSVSGHEVINPSVKPYVSRNTSPFRPGGRGSKCSPKLSNSRALEMATTMC